MEKIRCVLNKIKNSWIEIMYVTLFMFYTSTIVYANNDVWNTLNTTINDVYTELLKISTGLMAVIVVATTLIGMFSQNTRSVDQAYTWRKRAVIGWILINSLGFLVAYGENILKGGQFKLN